MSDTEKYDALVEAYDRIEKVYFDVDPQSLGRLLVDDAMRAIEKIAHEILPDNLASAFEDGCGTED